MTLYRKRFLICWKTETNHDAWSKVISAKITSCRELLIPQNYQFHSNSENHGYCNFSWIFLEILLYIRFFVSQKRYTKTKMFHKFKPLYRDATIQALIGKLDSPSLPCSITTLSCNLVFYVALYFRKRQAFKCALQPILAA